MRRYLVLQARLRDVKDVVCQYLACLPRTDRERQSMGGWEGGEGVWRDRQIVEESIPTGLGRGWRDWEGGKGTEGRKKGKVGKRRFKPLMKQGQGPGPGR